MKSILVSAALAPALIAGLAACGPPSSPEPTADGGVLADIPSFVDTAQALGPARVTVTQADGRRFSFDDPGDGVTLVYFGYTSCPDVCPTTMADLTAGLRALPEDVAEQFSVRFVTTDPRRDTRKQLRAWLGGFGMNVIGARAPIDDVIKAAEAYGIFIKPPKITKGNYEVTHGAQVLALGPDGAAIGYFRDGTSAQTYAKALPGVLEEANS